jgi:hypothetical protein
MGKKLKNMSAQILKEGSVLRVVQTGQTDSIIEIQDLYCFKRGDFVVLKQKDKESSELSIRFTDVTLPLVATIDDLKDTIDDYLESTVFQSLISVYDVSLGNTSATSLRLPKQTSASVQFISNNFNTADSVLKIQGSNDGVNFNDITDGSIIIPIGASVNAINHYSFPYLYLKVVFTVNTLTVGDLTVNLLAK